MVVLTSRPGAPGIPGGPGRPTAPYRRSHKYTITNKDTHSDTANEMPQY